MATLVHEIWLVPDEDGQDLPMCVLAGPDGDGARSRNPPEARLLCTFDAGSYFEAMTIYYARMELGPYTTDQAWAYEPYPREWLETQRGARAR
jgi:hypothetical protein